MLSQLPSIFLVGPMGAGKTTMGRLLAKHLQWEFYDSDLYIEEQTGASIAWIFEKEGEVGFRERETKAINELSSYKNIVLATGGGAIMCEQNREMLSSRGVVIYLKASVETQLERTSRDKSRPLLQNSNPKEVLQKLYEVRDPLYREVADIIIPTGYMYPRKMLLELLQGLKHYQSRL